MNLNERSVGYHHPTASTSRSPSAAVGIVVSSSSAGAATVDNSNIGGMPIRPQPQQQQHQYVGSGGISRNFSVSNNKTAPSENYSPVLLLIPFVFTILFILTQIDAFTERHNDYDPYNDRQLADGKRVNKIKEALGRFQKDVAAESDAWAIRSQLRAQVAAQIQRLKRVVERQKEVVADKRNVDAELAIVADSFGGSSGERWKGKRGKEKFAAAQKEKKDGSNNGYKYPFPYESAHGASKSEIAEIYGPHYSLAIHGDPHPKIDLFTQASWRHERELPQVEETMPRLGYQRLGVDVRREEDGLFVDTSYDRTIPQFRKKGRLAFSASEHRSAAKNTADSLSGVGDDVAMVQLEPPTSDQSSIFISIAAYRDEFCAPTLKSAFAAARFPERVFAGIVRQQEDADGYKCVDAAFLDVSTCMTAAFCPRDNIRMRLQHPTQAKGPTHGRYVSMLLYQGEQFAMIIDSHTLFAPRWDLLMIQDVWSMLESGRIIEEEKKNQVGGRVTDPESGVLKQILDPRNDTRRPDFVPRSYQFNYREVPEWLVDPTVGLAGGGKAGVISHYPPSFENFAQKLDWVNLRVLTVMCSAHYLKDPQTMGLIRMDGSNLLSKRRGGATIYGIDPVPRLQPFTAAGFLFGDAAFMLDTPFDPHLDFMFDGEEILYTTRLWTNGYDSYAPSQAVVAHIYGRAKAHRVWSVPNNEWWKHQKTAHLRYHYFMGTYQMVVKDPRNAPKTEKPPQLQMLGVRKAMGIQQVADGRVLLKLGKRNNTRIVPAKRMGGRSDEMALGASTTAIASGEANIASSPTTTTTPANKPLVSFKDLITNNKTAGASIYGMGSYRPLAEFYAYADIDRVHWEVKNTHCLR